MKRRTLIKALAAAPALPILASCDGGGSSSYYGKAPAAIVDLKSAVRYVRYNKGRLPGNPDWIVASGGSAGGALSTLLAASGNSPMYDSFLSALGGAEVSDAIFASASYSPITGLDHADMAYEWMWGTLPLNGKLVNQTYSAQLKHNFTGYMQSLALPGLGGIRDAGRGQLRQLPHEGLPRAFGHEVSRGPVGVGAGGLPEGQHLDHLVRRQGRVYRSQPGVTSALPNSPAPRRSASCPRWRL